MTTTLANIVNLLKETELKLSHLAATTSHMQLGMDVERWASTLVKMKIEMEKYIEKPTS